MNLQDLKALALKKLTELYATAKVPVTRRSEFKRDVSCAIEEVRTALEPADVVYALFKLTAKHDNLKKDIYTFLNSLPDP